MQKKSFKYLITKTGLFWWWVALIVIIVDQLTKFLALSFLTFDVPKPIMPLLNLTLMRNTGAAFSFLEHYSWSVWFFGLFAVLISIVILFWLSKVSVTQKWLSTSLALILGGALGNLIDRIHYGFVIDFIQLYLQNWYWPAVFNIADLAITVGAVMLGIDVLFLGKKQRNE